MALLDGIGGHSDDEADFRKEYEAQIAAFTPRQKALFDKFYKAPPLSNLINAETGQKMDFSSHKSNIKAYEDAIDAMNKQNKRNKIAFEQAKKIGRRPDESEKPRLKIRQDSKGTKSKSTASGRYSDNKRSNALKISSGAQ